VTRTTITDPDGRVTTVVTRSGCGSGCSGCFWILLGLFVLVVPAASFPLALAVLAYALEALLAVLAVRQWLSQRRISAGR
jgi:threonine/homoserine/homoserine lactone efflux protein